MSKVLQRSFAKRWFDPWQSRRVQVLLRSYVKSDDFEGRKKENVFGQYFKLLTPMDENDETLPSVSCRCATDDGMAHPVSFDPSHCDIVEAGIVYEAISFSSIVSGHHTVRENYHAVPLRPLESVPEHRRSLNCDISTKRSSASIYYL